MAPLKARQVIVTSYLFPGAKFSLERLVKLHSIVGTEKLVIDLRYDPCSIVFLLLKIALLPVAAGSEIAGKLQ